MYTRDLKIMKKDANHLGTIPRSRYANHLIHIACSISKEEWDEGEKML